MQHNSKVKHDRKKIYAATPIKHASFHFSAGAFFLQRSAMKIRGSSTMIPNAEVMSFQNDTCEVIDHEQHK